MNDFSSLILMGPPLAVSVAILYFFTQTRRPDRLMKKTADKRGRRTIAAFQG